MNIGFSTGSLALGDFKKGIALLKQAKVTVIEISALRETELDPLLQSIDDLDLSSFGYVSFHAPSKLVQFSENELVIKLKRLTKKGFPIIVHPDIIENTALWSGIGSLLCIENMDKRKPIGRTATDLAFFFERLPKASFCLDLAHARQVDPTMAEARSMILQFGSRLTQLHVSTVNEISKHEPLNAESLLAFKKIIPLIDPQIPAILESPVSGSEIKNEIRMASYLFNTKAFEQVFANAGMIV
jgi:hypothetical protein